VGLAARGTGRYYLSFPVPDRPVPPWSALRPGKTVPLGELGRYVASDLKRAQYVAALGELPERLDIDGRNIRTADLTGDRGGFATLDYGVEGDEADVYVGREVPFAELGLDASRLRAPPKHHLIGSKGLKCPHARPMIEEGPRPTMRWPSRGAGRCSTPTRSLQHLGSSRTLLRHPAGLMVRAQSACIGWSSAGWSWRCTVEGVDYFWDE
jgi:hypothetical protein